jgi:hypothetical protein
MGTRRGSLATSARWEASSWTLALVLAVAGFWPWWAFHSAAGTFAWIISVVVLTGMLRARRRR